MLRDQVKEYLLDAILENQLQAGERLVETRLARQLGVSQAPVREAIRELEQMGLLETRTYKGTFVRRLTGAELRQIYAVRAVVEGLAAREAVERLTSADLARLEELVGQMVAAARAGDARLMVRRDIEFHQLVVRATCNPFLYRTWEQLANWTLVTVRVSRLPLLDQAARHRQVLDALASRDPALAEQAFRQHLDELAQAQSLGRGG